MLRCNSSIMCQVALVVVSDVCELYRRGCRGCVYGHYNGVHYNNTHIIHNTIIDENTPAQ